MARNLHPGKILVRGLIALCIAWVCFMMVTATMPGKTIPGRTRIVFWHRWGGEWEKVVGNIADRFNQSQTEFEVYPMFVTGQGAETKFMLSTIGGDPPDVMSMGSEQLPALASANLLSDLETLMTPEERDYFHRVPYDAVRRTGQYKGVTYGITIGADLMGYYVNCDHLRAIGADPDKPPKTFEELVELGKKLTKKDKNGDVVRLGLDTSDLITQSYAWGTGIQNEQTGELLMNTPSNEACLAALTDQRKFVGYQEALRFYASQNTGSSTGAWSFIPGSVSIAYDGQWRVEEIRKYNKGMDYRVWPLIPPKGGKQLAGSLGGNFMIIPVTSKHKRGGFEFLKFWSGLTHPERAAEFYTWGGWVPLSPDVANSPIYSAWLKDNPQFATFVNILAGDNCHPTPRIGFLNYYLDQIRRAETNALSGDMTPKQALQDLEKTVNTERAKRKELGFDD